MGQLLLKLYGIPASQASRCLWALEELALDYELELTRPGEDTSSAEFVALSPNRKIPVLVDGEFVLSESMAINLYLAESYGSDVLWPASKIDQMSVLQWSFWVAHDVEPHLWRFWQQQDRQAAAPLQKALEVLDGHLTAREWLLGGEFSIGDVNLESYIIRARRGGYSLADHPALHDWIERCEVRPARRRVREMIDSYEATHG